MKATIPTLLIGLAFGAALTACKSTSSPEGEGGGGNAGTISPMAGQGGSGAGGAAGTTGGAGGAGTGGSGGSSGMMGGSGGSGGGTPDGGAGGGGMMDAEVPDGSTQSGSCADGDYLLCEDFEGTAVGQIPDGWNTLGDPVAVADDQAASGTHALKCGPQNDGARRIWRDTSTLPTTHWGRVRFKVSLPVPDAFVHSTIVEFKGDSPVDDAHPDYRVVDTVKQQNGDGGNNFQWIYNVQPYSRAEYGHGSGYDRKFEDRWYCTEWYIDSVEQEYRFFVDGVELEEIGFHNGPGQYFESEIPDVFDEVSIGWTNYQSAPPGFTAWIDDFAIGTERVPCPP